LNKSSVEAVYARVKRVFQHGDDVPVSDGLPLEAGHPAFVRRSRDAQPWLGFRADFYPWRDWRFELGADAEGFGVDGGVWGWGASGLVSCSIADWLDVTGMSWAV
jgi:hypothetical protein